MIKWLKVAVMILHGILDAVENGWNLGKDDVAYAKQQARFKADSRLD